jgi:hypothetical protein
LYYATGISYSSAFRLASSTTKYHSYFYNDSLQACAWQPRHGNSHSNNRIAELAITLLKITAIKQILIQISAIFLFLSSSLKENSLPFMGETLEFM